MKITSLIILMLLSTVVQAADLPGIPAFIDEMVAQHQFKRDELVKVFQRAERKQEIIEAISKPATLKPWVEYRPNFINPQRVELGLKFWKQHANVLHRAEKQFGVPQEYILAIIGVETLYGRNTGKYRTLDALTTLAFDYPKRESFFRAELAQYLLLAREQGFNLLAVQSSYAGALGYAQFMPSNFRKYALDYNGNGKVDILREPEDAIGSVGNYFKHYGWREGEPVALMSKVEDTTRLGVLTELRPTLAWRVDAGVTPVESTKSILPPSWMLDLTVESGKQYWLVFENFNVIMRYNISTYYAMSVHQLAMELKAAKR
ncbi:MAG: lytic murein transglycosylase B [Sideroxydans sp.]|nr:lytic murein transglycosylase B [Sideroxydans sp.]NOT97913.1 lytic murein transglycosylase B [Sideroxydans sp.]